MKNRSFFSIAAVAFTAILIATPANAQILWGTVSNVSTDTDVATNGTYFDAALFQDGANSGNPVTVNGVVFNIIAHGNALDSDHFAPGSVNPPAGYTGGYITLSSSRNPFVGGTAPGASSAYDTLLSAAEYGQNQTQTIKLSNLTVGDTYQVEIWSSAIGKGGYITDLSGTNSVALNANTGQFVIGTFTADATTFSFTSNFDASSANKVNMLNAISVFDEGVISVPEPSSYALLLSGVLALFFLRFRRNANA